MRPSTRRPLVFSSQFARRSLAFSGYGRVETVDFTFAATDAGSGA
jgi:hypothetical protein